MQFEDKFVAFIDILGFKRLVEKSEVGLGPPLEQLLEYLALLGTPEDSERFKRSGPRTCPLSKKIEKDLNFKITQVSDCALISSEISPAGVINLISHSWGAVTGLLMEGVLCRGYITRGSVFHTSGQVIGTGYQNAYAKESGVSAFKVEADERGTPFVEVAPSVCGFVKNETDDCVREMFSRFTKAKDGVTAIYPFQRFTHSLGAASFMGEDFDPYKERESNNNLRKLLWRLINQVESFVDTRNDRAVSKARHYVNALREQLLICDDTDEMIDRMCASFPRKF